MPSIKLLKEAEANHFDLPPNFDNDDRLKFFNVEGIFNYGLNFRKLETKVGFILLRGYFLATKKFYNPSDFIINDIRFVCKLFGTIIIDIKNYKKDQYSHHRIKILEFYGYKPFQESKNIFFAEADELVKTSLRPKQLFYSLISFLEEHKIEIPKYYIFTDAISKALNEFEEKLLINLNSKLTENQKQLLDSLMNIKMLDEKTSPKNPYLITKLKKPIQALTPRKIKESIQDFETIADVHNELVCIIDSINIMSELINYYAVWVIKADHIQFESISDITRKRLYLISFIFYQYRLRQDLFVDTFIQLTQRHNNLIEKSIADDFLKSKLTRNEQLDKVKEIVLSSKEQLDKLREIIRTPHFTNSQKIEFFNDILFLNNKSIHENLLNEIDLIKNSNTIHDEMLYQQYISQFTKLSNRVAGIISIINFDEKSSNTDIIDAINYFKEKKGRITNSCPLGFIDLKLIKWLYDKNGDIISQIYKTLLFIEISNHIKAGSLNLKYSEDYKAIEEYLISEEKWNKNKKKLLARSNLEKISNCYIYLPTLEKQLNEQYIKTNENISKNQHIKFNKDGKPKVITPKIENTNEKTLQDFLDVEDFLPLIQILSDINVSTSFTSSFTHYSKKGGTLEIENELLYAGIIGLGCNIGVKKMGKISNGISSSKIDYVKKWYFSKQNIEDAIRVILDLTSKLSLPKIYQSTLGQSHTSSDGQKFDVTVPSVHATHSFKYFGTGKGVSVYSFIDDQSKLFHNSVISASEREAAYVIDGLLFNEEIESNIHSTDTHGYSELVFGISNSLGILFAPRIKNYSDQMIYTFKSNPRKIYESYNYKILPTQSKYINTDYLINQWDTILRLLCSIKLKETLASKVFKRLSSYSKQHPLYKALKELGRIHKTIFLLRYFDEVNLRQKIEKQLNKVELSHQFAKAIFFGNNQEFKLDSKEEQEIAVACRHLIQNSIILWNYLYLSQKLISINDLEKYDEMISELKSCSIMSWEHVNLHGEYNFKQIVKSQEYNIEKFIDMHLTDN